MAADAGATSELINLCAGLPLALGIVIARRDTSSVTEILAELAATEPLDAFDGGEPNADIRAVFSWSYRNCRTRRLNYFGCSACIRDLTSRFWRRPAGVPPAAGRMLDELTRHNLLTEHAPRRFGMHDLLRAYSAEKFVLTTVRRSDVWRSTGSWTTNCGYWHEWAMAGRVAVATARRCGAQYGLARSHHNLGNALIRLGMYDDPRGHFRDALDLRRRIGDLRGQACNQNGLARVDEHQGKYHDTHDHARQALTLYLNAGHEAGQAVACYRRGLELREEIGDRYDQAVALTEVPAMNGPGRRASSWIATSRPEGALPRYWPALRGLPLMSLNASDRRIV